MRKVLLAMGAAASIVSAAAPFATATDRRDRPERNRRPDRHGWPYHHARVLEPGSRGNVVEI
jgi:hypothetical protein